MADFHFLRPEWLWAILPLLLLVWLVKRFPKNQQDWQGIISAHLYQHLFAGTAGTNSHTSTLPAVLFFSTLLAILGAAGPTLEKLPRPVFSVNEGHVVVLDMSLSMRSTDITPDRMTRAKYKAIDLVKKINEGEIGLIAYAGEPFTISPLTADTNTLETLIPSLSPEIMPVQGSDPYLALTHAADLLTQSGYPNGTIYWITDGIDIEDNQVLSEWINSSPLQINILAVGTKNGAPITQANGELFKDNTGNIVIPKLNSAPLFSLARQAGGKASEITSDETDINTITSRILPPDATDNFEQNEQLSGDQWRELGPWLVLAALPFFVYLFRRGTIVVMLVSVLGMFTSPQYSYAQEVSTERLSTVKNWFKNKDQQGLDAYQSEDYAHAATTFDDPMWKGSALYRQGNYQDAISEFEKIDSAESWYNRGNALAKSGQLQEASEAYAEAIDRQQDYNDAIQNKALVDELLKQQQEQQNDQEQDNSDQNNDNQDNQQNQDNQNSDSQQNSEQDQQESNEQQQSDAEQQNQQDSANDESQNDSDPSQSQDQQQQEQQEQNSQAQEEQEQSANNEPEFNEQQNPQQNQQETENAEQQQAVQNAVPEAEELTDEEREKQQKIEALLRRVPNDPAFLLQQKMRLEAQKRARQRRPASQEKKW